MFKGNDRNTTKRSETCWKLTMKASERRHWRCSGVFIVNFEHISHLFLVFLLLTCEIFLGYWFVRSMDSRNLGFKALIQNQYCTAITFFKKVNFHWQLLYLYHPIFVNLSLSFSFAGNLTKKLQISFVELKKCPQKLRDNNFYTFMNALER